MPARKTVSFAGKTGCNIEARPGEFFFVKTLFAASAVERARQEYASGRPFVSAAIYEAGKLLRIVDFRALDPKYADWESN